MKLSLVELQAASYLFKRLEEHLGAGEGWKLSHMEEGYYFFELNLDSSSGLTGGEVGGTLELCKRATSGNWVAAYYDEPPNENDDWVAEGDSPSTAYYGLLDLFEASANETLKAWAAQA